MDQVSYSAHNSTPPDPPFAGLWSITWPQTCLESKFYWFECSLGVSIALDKDLRIAALNRFRSISWKGHPTVCLYWPLKTNFIDSLTALSSTRKCAVLTINFHFQIACSSWWYPRGQDLGPWGDWNPPYAVTALATVSHLFLSLSPQISLLAL